MQRQRLSPRTAQTAGRSQLRLGGCTTTVDASTGAGPPPLRALSLVRKRISCAFDTANDHFTKTGSGQAYRENSKGDAISHRRWRYRRPADRPLHEDTVRLQKRRLCRRADPHRTDRSRLLYGGAMHGYVKETRVLRCHLILKLIILPRQAPDKHRIQ